MTEQHERTWRLLRLTVGVLIRILLRPRVKGREHLPRSGPVLLVSNHQSFWDIPVLGYAQPRVIRFMAKAELFRHRLFGRLILAGGGFPVRRGEADRDALRTVHETMQAGGVVGIFIQGHRQMELDGAKAGAGRCAGVEEVPVVPVAIVGTRGWRLGKRVQVVFGERRTYHRDGRRPAQAYRETADELMADIRQLYEGA
ncbi:MAG: lysophospholipid acyltransferase family protein [Gaiellales bacterium]